MEDIKHTRNSPPEVFLGKGVLKICGKFIGEHPYRSVISIKLQSSFTEITLRHGCSPVNLLYIFRTSFPKKTSGMLLLAYRNLRSTLMNESKKICYTRYFESNWNNIKNTWKGIKTIISIENTTTTYSAAMSNVFNNYFTYIAEKTKLNTKFRPNIT